MTTSRKKIILKSLWKDDSQEDIPTFTRGDMTDKQKKSLKELEQISKPINPGEELLEYYRRGKEAWGEDSDEEDPLVWVWWRFKLATVMAWTRSDDSDDEGNEDEGKQKEDTQTKRRKSW